MSQCFYEFGPYRMDVDRRRLHRDGEVVPLTPKAFDILLALVASPGEVIEKNELMKRVWPDSFVEDGNLTYNISVLRKALGERAGEHQYIVTVPGRGYRFVAAVSQAWPADTEAAALEPPATGENSGPRTADIQPVSDATANPLARVARHRLGLIAGVLALAVLVIVGGYLLLRRSDQNAVSAVGQPAIRTLAVLPLANGGDDADMEYLSDGISESLINSLSQLPGLKVIARSSSFKYKGKDADPQEVARALGVDTIVTGRVLQRGDALSISVELMDARDKTQLWGEQYSRRATDLLALQSEISGEIARNLRLKLTSAEQQQLAKRETVNPQAYELLLKGRFNWNKGGTENRKKAIEYFNQAIALDPTYALAYAEMSMNYGVLANVGVLDPKEFKLKVEWAALKALEFDDTLAEAHLALGWVRMAAWDWAAADREFHRAIELSPNLARAHSMYSMYLSLMGQHEQAIAEVKRARELNPLSVQTRWAVGYRLLLARQNDQAIEAAKKTLELDQNYPDAHNLLGYAYAAKGQYREAIAAYQEAIRLGDDSPDTQIYLGAAYAKAGERERAQAILKRLEASKPYISLTTLADFYVALGEREQAFASLERAYAAHDNQLQFLRISPHMDPLRDDPRFQDLLRRVGLAP